MYEYLDELAKKCDLVKIDKYTFHTKGNENDLANLGLFVCRCGVKNEWLTKNVKEWIWISQKDGNNNMIGNKFGNERHFGRFFINFSSLYSKMRFMCEIFLLKKTINETKRKIY